MDDSVTNFEPWVHEFVDRITTTVKEGVMEWCNIVSLIGLSGDQLQKWMEVYEKEINEILYEMKTDAETNRDKIIVNIKELLQLSEKLCRDLHIPMPNYGSQRLCLLQEQEYLCEKKKTYEEMLQKRRAELEYLVNQMKEVCSALGRQPKQLPMSHLPSSESIKKYQEELEFLEREKCSRLKKFTDIKCEIIKLASELKYQPGLDCERKILSADGSDIDVSDENMENLVTFHMKLKEHFEWLKAEIAAEIEEVKDLWEILEEDRQKCSQFLESCTENSNETLDKLKAEVKRCENLKRANIEVFVKKVRNEIVHYWDLCHVNERVRNEFRFIEDELFTEDLLSLHDIELDKWKKFYRQNLTIFETFNKWNQAWKKFEQLEKAAEAPDRYKNRGGRLLKEEKERNQLNKQIIKLEEKLRDLGEKYEAANRGEKIYIYGEPMQDVLDKYNENKENDRKLKLSARKQQRDATATPGMSTMFLTPKSAQTHTSNVFMGSSCKRKLLTVTPSSTKKSKLLRVPSGLKTAPPNLPCSKVAGGRSRYSVEKKKKEKRCKKSLSKGDITPKLTNTTYEIFKKELSTKEMCRSTETFTTPLAVPLDATPRPRRPRL